MNINYLDEIDNIQQRLLDRQHFWNVDKHINYNESTKFGKVYTEICIDISNLNFVIDSDCPQCII